ncbi:MAG: copper homeostasis protein [Parvicellaceae bacterium]|jgi:copper homeostasis protein
MKTEVCIESFEEAIAADQYGINRIELCAALDLGGLTPSSALIEKCAAEIKAETHVMIRPRPGNFIYTSDEIEIMALDIARSGGLEAKGVVFGCLNSDLSLDHAANSYLVSVASQFNLEITFHRAIDFCSDYLESISEVSQLGFNRVLTSGQAPNVDEGKSNIESISQLSELNIEVMVGSGVNAQNINALVKMNIDAVHFSIRKVQEHSDQMGNTYCIDHDKIKAILNEIK